MKIFKVKQRIKILSILIRPTVKLYTCFKSNKYIKEYCSKVQIFEDLGITEKMKEKITLYPQCSSMSNTNLDYLTQNQLRRFWG